MKTLQPLLLLALLITFAAWFSVQGVSQATNLPANFEVPLAEPAMPATHSAAPLAPRPPSVKINNPAAKTKATSPLQAALQAGDLCETARLLNGALSGAEQYAALLGAIDAGPELQEAFGPNGPMMASDAKSAHYASPVANALWALKLAGLLYAPISGAQDLPAAHALLLALEKKEPGNAFYPFFRLAVEEKLNYTKDQLKTTAAEIANGTTFDSHFTTLDREIRDAAWQNPALHYAVRYFYTANVFAYYRTVQTLKTMARSGDFSGEGNLARLMTEQGLHAARSSASGDFIATQYSWGRNLDPDRYPMINDLEKEKGETGDTYGPSIHVERDGDRVCDPSAYETFFYEAREGR